MFPNASLIVISAIVLTGSLCLAGACDCTGEFSPAGLVLANESYNETLEVWEGYGSLTAISLDTDCENLEYEFMTDKYVYVWSALLDGYGSYSSYEFESLYFSATSTFKVFNIYVRAAQRVSSWKNYLLCEDAEVDFAWGIMQY